MKMAVFWVVAPYSLVEVYRRFRGSSCPHKQGHDKFKLTAKSLINSLVTKMQKVQCALQMCCRRCVYSVNHISY
jgi:hypothetical protein